MKSGTASISLEQPVIKALSNTNRYAIIKLLMRAKKDFCVSEISEEIGISQSLTSHQLAYLEAHGIVTGRRMGQTMCYTLTGEPVAQKAMKVIKILT